MTNQKLLREAIDRSGYKITFVAKAAGLSYQGFLNKMKGLSDFGNTEITKICKLLKIDETEMVNIFFTEMVDET